MIRKSYKQVLAVGMAALLFTAAGCSLPADNSSAAADSAAESVTLNIHLINNVENIEGVLEKFYEMTKDTLNIRLNIQGAKDSVYRQTLSMKLQSFTNIDLCFDAPWMGMSTRIEAGEYLDLEPYFNNDAYPGLKKAFSQEYLNANRKNKRLYGFPIMSTYLDPNGITYRKDLLEKFNLGFDTISSYTQLEQFLQAAMQENPGIYPLALSQQSGFFLMFTNKIDLMNNGIYDVGGWDSLNFPVRIVLSDDRRTVKDVVFATDEDSRFAALGGKYNYNFFREQYENQKYWSKYTAEYSMVAETPLSEQIAGLNIAGASFTFQEQLRNAGIEEAVVDFWAYDQVFASEEAMTKGGVSSPMQAWNFLCIPSESKNIEASIRFLDWLFSSQENMELFEFGVEGEDWTAVGTTEYDVLTEKGNRYTFPSYCMAWNPNYVRTATTLTDSEKKIADYIRDPDSYTQIPLAGWSFDSTKAATEVARLEAEFSQYRLTLAHGKYDRQLAELLAEMRTKFENNGLEKVRTQIIFQAQEFLDSNL